MKKNPLLSVIIPVYNVSQYIDQCISSVLMSTYSNLEIILIDDGSTDDSGSICDKYAKTDSRISVIHQANMGLSAARNSGMNIMHGEYVAFLDSDDWVEPNCYENAMLMITTHNLSCVHYNINMVSCDGSKVLTHMCMSKHESIITKDKLLSILLSGNRKYQFVWNAIYDARLWKKIKFPVGRNWEDVSTKYLAIYNSNKGIGFIPNYLINYRYNPNGISHRAFSIDSLYQLFLGYKERYDFALEKEPSLASKCLSNSYIVANYISKFKSNNELTDYERNIQSECSNYARKYRKKVFTSPKSIFGVMRMSIEFCYWLFRIYMIR